MGMRGGFRVRTGERSGGRGMRYAVAGLWLLLGTAAHADSGPVLVRAQSLLAEARANPAVQADLLERGRERSAFCAACHGAGGESTRPDYPDLAGQSIEYLLTQFGQFQGAERYRKVMNDLMAKLTDDEKALLAVYYALQSPQPEPAADAALVASGAKLYAARCQSCHGADAHGKDGRARLAGQKPGYLLRVLTDFRQGHDRSPDSVMRSMVQGLSEADLQALAGFLGAQP